MSTVKSKNLQIGTDGTASNNFTIYQPGTPDGTLRVGNGNVGAATDVVTVNSSGNVNFDSGTLYVNATNNRVGIGTVSPSHNLQVYSASNPEMRLGDATVTYQLYTDGSTAAITGTVGNHDLVYRTNATERMRIDSSGRVTMPYQPYFFAQRSTTWTGWVPNNQTQPMLFDNVITNLGNHFNGSTGLFTAPVAGVYQFWSGIYSPGYTQTQHWPVINGGRKTTYALYPAGANNITGTFFITLNANDTVGFHAFDGASSGQVTAAAEHTFFYGHLIG